MIIAATSARAQGRGVTDASLPVEGAVADMQGLYGAYTFPEKLLQQIWLRGEFDHASARLADGRSLRVLHPGRWNLLGGPDFTDARLRMGDDAPDVHGDVEVHLHAADWEAHGHARDPAYDRVVLHVVLFPIEPGQITRDARGAPIPVLVVLPLLHRGLEEFAEDDAVEKLARRGVARLPEELAALPESEVGRLLADHAERRWQQKLRFAHLRIDRLGWDAACHHTALEILGYRFNRATMLRIAGEWPLRTWADGTVNIEEVFLGERGRWSLQGVRPANYPSTRLRQYARWVKERPAWPAEAVSRLASLAALPADVPIREARRRGNLRGVRTMIGAGVCGDALGGTRLDTFVCNGLFPLVAATGSEQLRSWWTRWFPGDLPAGLTAGLRQLRSSRRGADPAAHGVAQGLLGWLLARERER